MLNGLQLQFLSSSCQIGTLMMESHLRIGNGRRHFETEPSVFKTASSFLLKSWRCKKELCKHVFVLSFDCWSPNSWTLLQLLLKVYQPRGQQTLMEVRNVYCVRQGTSSQYQKSYLDLGFWYCICPTQPIITNTETAMPTISTISNDRARWQPQSCKPIRLTRVYGSVKHVYIVHMLARVLYTRASMCVYSRACLLLAKMPGLVCQNDYNNIKGGGSIGTLKSEWLRNLCTIPMILHLIK